MKDFKDKSGVEVYLWLNSPLILVVIYMAIDTLAFGAPWSGHWEHMRGTSMWPLGQ